MTFRVRAVAGLLLVCSLSCARPFDPAHFAGSREPRRATPEAVVELAARASYLRVLGHVQASCFQRDGFRRLEGETLTDVDCGVPRLDWALRESAAAAGGDALLAPICGSYPSGTRTTRSVVIRCSAEVARFTERPPANFGPPSPPRSGPPRVPAPSPSAVSRLDEPDASLAFRILLSFEPKIHSFQRRPRGANEVKELAFLPLADQPLGDLSARCEDGCEERALRYGVLVAAGRLGVPDVVAVRCFSTGSANTCVGTLAAPALDE